jgi:isoquinoline 1-oxidoreductase alpha subunit
MINKEEFNVDVDADTPLLWVLRDFLDLKGTKFGCGKGLCGACTIHFDGQAMRSCQLPVSAAVGAEITTIEGLSADGTHPVQKAWRDHNVPQCGYCQSGQIMNASAFLSNKPELTDTNINNAMEGNICRCGTYPRIRAAIKQAGNELFVDAMEASK